MYLVSGTKRSGTSMWMQILAAAGVPVLGKAFPRNWEKSSLREANPDGFYESILRQGIYFRTNPHPTSGEYFMPDQVNGYAVKVFVPGVVRTERAYVDLLIANVREWREYEASINRLYSLEDRDREKHEPESEPPFRFPPALEWWMENFALVRDISLRRYSHQLQTYDQVVAQPRKTLTEVLGRLDNDDLDLDKAVEAVKPGNRTQDTERETLESEAVDPELAKVFDELYAVVKERRPLSGTFLKTINATNQSLLPRLTELQTQVIASMQKRKGAGLRAEPVAGLPER